MNFVQNWQPQAEPPSTQTVRLAQDAVLVTNSGHILHRSSRATQAAEQRVLAGCDTHADLSTSVKVMQIQCCEPAFSMLASHSSPCHLTAPKAPGHPSQHCGHAAAAQPPASPQSCSEPAQYQPSAAAPVSLQGLCRSCAWCKDAQVLPPEAACRCTVLARWQQSGRLEPVQRHQM